MIHIASCHNGFMYSVTKEKSNEKIQKVILYSSLHFKWGYHVLPWGAVGNSRAVNWPVTQAGNQRPCETSPYPRVLLATHWCSLPSHLPFKRLGWYFHVNVCPIYWPPIRHSISICLKTTSLMLFPQFPQQLWISKRINLGKFDYLGSG